MDNNQMNFDPMTGQPLNNQNNTVAQNPMQPIPHIEQIPTAQPVAPNLDTPGQVLNIEPTVQLKVNQTISTADNSINTQQQMQSIATVEQSTQDFINNVQANSTEKKEEKKDGPNIAFIIILFAIIFAAIIFLFPYLLKTL